MKKNDSKILQRDNIPVKVNLVKNIPFNKKNLNMKNIETTSKIKTENISNISNNALDEMNNINNTNFFRTNNNFHKKSKTKNEIKNISNYVSFNKSMLLSAYEESITILFENLKSYMKNDLFTFNKIKLNFIKNVQKFYQRNKDKILSTISPTKKYSKKHVLNKHISRPNLKSQLNLMNFKNKSNHTAHIVTNKYLHKKNKSQSNKSMTKLISGLSNYTLNKSNSSIKSPLNCTIANKNLNNDYNNKNNKNTTHRQSLYTLIRGNKPIISNSPTKNCIRQRHQFSILNNFINFNKNGLQSTQGDAFENEEKKKNKINKINYKNCCLNINPDAKNELSNYFTNINQNINNNIYYNNIISQIPSKKNNKTATDEEVMNDELISCIKNSLDDNLKGIFDFSYKSFLNKESERECN